MGGNLLYDFGGLVTAPGLLSRNPASCVSCDNVTFPIAGVMRKRRGYAKMTGELAAGGSFINIFSTETLGSNYLAFCYNPSSPDFAIGDGSGAWTAITSYTIEDKFIDPSEGASLAALGPGHYVTSGEVMRIESTFAKYYSAGMPRGLAPITYSMGVYNVLTQAAGAFLGDGSNVAYRVTIHRKDESGKFDIGGPPSSRLIVRCITGTSGYVSAANPHYVTLRIPVPFLQDSLSQKCTTEYYWRLWRSRTAALTTADDEMFLEDEAFFTAADIANGYAVAIDNTPDSLLIDAPTLHTNSSNFPALGAGLLNGQTMANEAPPGCQDIAVYANCMFYGNVLFRPYKQYQLIALPAANNTLTVNHNGVDVILKCVAGAPANPGEFKLVNTLSTISLNIEATARNMVDAYTRAVTTGAKALYISQGSQQPGIIGFESGDWYTDLKFTASSSGVGALFRPIVSTTGDTTTFVQKNNVVCFSNPGTPDNVPPVNQLEVGPAYCAIIKMVPFRERLIVFTTSGTYEINGQGYNSFSVSPLDLTFHLLAKRWVATCEDRVYAWGREGIAEFSDGGRTIVSAPIEPTIQTIINGVGGLDGINNATFKYCFAVASVKNHSVLFFYPDPLEATQKYLEFDARAKKWTRHIIQTGDPILIPDLRTCGCEAYAKSLVTLGGDFSNAIKPTLFIERASYASSDFQDTDVSGVSYPIASGATFQFQLPDVDARHHWQQLLCEFEDSEQSFYPRPTSVDFLWETDTTGAGGTVTATLTSPIVRVETPRAYRRSTRQRATISHALAEHFGILVLKQFYADGSTARFPK